MSGSPHDIVTLRHSLVSAALAHARVCLCVLACVRARVLVCMCACAGDEILAWLESTEGSPATIDQDILDTKNILAELKKQQEDLQGRQRPDHAVATSTRRGARSKSKNSFAAVEAE